MTGPSTSADAPADVDARSDEPPACPLDDLARSLEMIAMLPSIAENQALPQVARRACAEAFSTHAGSLARFFLSAPKDRQLGASVASDHLPHWELDRPTAKHLRSLCRLTSDHTEGSDPDRPDEPVAADHDGLGTEAQLLFDVTDRFIRHLRAGGRDADADTVQASLPRPRLWTD